MADTGRSIIQAAYEGIKIYPPGVTMNAADSSRGLSELNDMLDEWSNQPYACFANLEQSFPLVPGKNTYTIGTSGGADIVGTRPLDILTGMGAAYLVDANGVRFPVNVIQQDQWNMIGLLTNVSQLPDTLFYDPQFPLGIINIFPTPSIAYVLFFDSRLQLADLADLDVAFSLPPGYSSALKSNLRVRLWPFFKQGDPTPWMVKLAEDSFANVKRTNMKSTPSTYDSAITARGSSSYNIFTDNQGRNSR